MESRLLESARVVGVRFLLPRFPRVLPGRVLLRRSGIPGAWFRWVVGVMGEEGGLSLAGGGDGVAGRWAKLSVNADAGPSEVVGVAVAVAVAAGMAADTVVRRCAACATFRKKSKVFRRWYA